MFLRGLGITPMSVKRGRSYLFLHPSRVHMLWSLPWAFPISGSISIISLVLLDDHAFLKEWRTHLCWWNSCFLFWTISHFTSTRGRIVDFPVWHGTRGPFFRELQWIGCKQLQMPSPKSRAHFPSSLTESDSAPPTRLSIFGTLSPQHHTQAPQVSMTPIAQGKGGGDSGKWNFLFSSLLYLENMPPPFL